MIIIMIYIVIMPYYDFDRNCLRYRYLYRDNYQYHDYCHHYY